MRLRKISTPSTKPLTPTFLTREDPSPALPIKGREWLPLFAMLSCDLGIGKKYYLLPFPRAGEGDGGKGLLIQLRIRNPRMIHTLELVDKDALGGGDVAESDRTLTEIAVSNHTVDDTIHEFGDAFLRIFLQ